MTKDLHSFRELDTQQAHGAAEGAGQHVDEFQPIFEHGLVIGSKLEIVMLSGVSSTISSTPVAASIARIFLPSLPIILPLSSSVGSGITETVISVVRSVAHF